MGPRCKFTELKAGSTPEERLGEVIFKLIKINLLFLESIIKQIGKSTGPLSPHFTDGKIEDQKEKARKLL